MVPNCIKIQNFVHLSLNTLYRRMMFFYNLVLKHIAVILYFTRTSSTLKTYWVMLGTNTPDADERSTPDFLSSKVLYTWRMIESRP